jgi:hypothetical protein
LETADQRVKGTDYQHAIRLKLFLCLDRTGLNSPLKAIFEQTKTRRPAAQAAEL